MRINQAGIDLVKHFEGLRLEAYPDPATGGEPITIGYGHTGGVKLGTKISQHQAEDLLLEDLDRVADRVLRLVRLGTDNQLAAVTSLVFNIGVGNFQHSTMLKLLEKGDFKAAAEEFPKWDKANGKVMPGLLARRNAERELFLT